MPIAGSIESKIANWPAVRPPILRGAAGWEQRGDGVDRTRGIIHDAPRAEALRRELVRNSGRSRVLLRRACLLSEFSSLQLGGLRS